MDLVHFERFVNDRLGTSPPPVLPGGALPEDSEWLPLAWARVASSDLSVLADGEGGAGGLLEAMRADLGGAAFPVHPLVEGRFSPASLVRCGSFAPSASYRTVFWRPEPGGGLAGLVPEGQIAMVKLHLDEPLPGIPGDRRLTPEKVRKCVTLSGVLADELDRAGGGTVRILRERFGLCHGDRGAIFRFVPASGVVPFFSLYSRDRTRPAEPPLVISLLRKRFDRAEEVVEVFGRELAASLLEPVLDGFRRGFSLEMHAQNTLVGIGPDGAFGDVYFRDLEGVVYFPELRARSGLDRLGISDLGPELLQAPRVAARWFNRNVDYDAGRILKWTVHVLEREGMLTTGQARALTARIRATARELIERYGMRDLARQGRWLRFSRSPYGNGLRPGHYYRATFR